MALASCRVACTYNFEAVPIFFFPKICAPRVEKFHKFRNRRQVICFFLLSSITSTKR